MRIIGKICFLKVFKSCVNDSDVGDTIGSLEKCKYINQSPIIFFYIFFFFILNVCSMKEILLNRWSSIYDFCSKSTWVLEECECQFIKWYHLFEAIQREQTVTSSFCFSFHFFFRCRISVFLFHYSYIFFFSASSSFLSSPHSIRVEFQFSSIFFKSARVSFDLCAFALNFAKLRNIVYDVWKYTFIIHECICIVNC